MSVQRIKITIIFIYIFKLSWKKIACIQFFLNKKHHLVKNGNYCLPLNKSILSTFKIRRSQTSITNSLFKITGAGEFRVDPESKLLLGCYELK